MGRIVQLKGTKGSLKWIQRVVNECPEKLNGPIRNHLAYKNDQAIEWLSPLADDDYSEYRDQVLALTKCIRFARVSQKSAIYSPNT